MTKEFHRLFYITAS